MHSQHWSVVSRCQRCRRSNAVDPRARRARWQRRALIAAERDQRRGRAASESDPRRRRCSAARSSWATHHAAERNVARQGPATINMAATVMRTADDGTRAAEPAPAAGRPRGGGTRGPEPRRQMWRTVVCVALTYRCPDHGVVASGRFAERLESERAPTCPERVRRSIESGKVEVGKCGRALTRQPTE